MKLKLHPVIYILGIYVALGIYLIFAYFGIYQNLKSIAVVDLTPLVYVVLGLGVALLTLSFFSILRIPLFHYLLKMLNLWVVVLLAALLWLYYKYEIVIWNMVGVDSNSGIVKVFPVSNPEIFKPLTSLLQTGLNGFKLHYLHILLVAAIILAIVQVFFYLPPSLRYVYHTHISPFLYTVKHLFISIVLLAVLLFGLNFYIKLDSGVNPHLETLLASESQPVNADANAFFPLLTIWMPNVTDRATTGKAWVANYNGMIDYFSRAGKPIVASQYPKYEPTEFQGMNPADRGAINKLFVERMTQMNFKPGQDINTYVKRYAYALSALRSLYAYKNYHNPIPYKGFSYTYFLKDYDASMLALHRLNLLEAMAAPKTATKSITNILFSDYFFNLMVIRNCNDPVNKMLYIKKQDITIDFINTLMRNPAYQTGAFYKLINYVPVMSEQDLDYSNIARNKMLFFKNLFNSYENTERSSILANNIFAYAFKYNKTLNCIYANLDKELNLSNLSPTDYLKAQQSGLKKARLTNVIGDTICSVSVPEYISSDFIRAIEANGRIIMLKARSKAYENGIREINVNVFLTNNSDKYYNPFTKQALNWDRDKKQIYFVYNNGKQDVRVSL